MPPLILHNVPEDELYTGEDGVQRPFAMIFPDKNDRNNPTLRSRRAVLETGSFGVSTRWSRSKTGVPAAKREDLTLVAAETIFNKFITQKATQNPELPPRPSILAPASQTSHLGPQLIQNEGISINSKFPKHRNREPTEVVLRGFKPTQQYAAIREYERIAGRILEDYPRDPPLDQRKFRIDPADYASLRVVPLTPEEKAKAHKFAGGNHWIKVTFESAETAEAAIECSPQKILGHIVIAELYRGVPPEDKEILASRNLGDHEGKNLDISQRLLSKSDHRSEQAERPSSLLASCLTTSKEDSSRNLISPPSLDPQYSSTNIDSGATTSRDTSTDLLSKPPDGFCQRLPSARRLKLLPAEEALLPQQSPMQKLIGKLPFVSWINRDIIGGAIPRTDNGDFNYSNASLYWKLMWLIEKLTGISLLGDSKDE